MPRKTAKAKILDDVYLAAAATLSQLDSSDESGEDEVHRNVEEDVNLVLSFHYGEIKSIPKQSIWLNEVLPAYDEGRFRQTVRLNHRQFDLVLNTINQNPIFYKKNLQIPVSVQLAITLYRFGNNGTRADVVNIAHLFGTGDGSTVTRVTRRALLTVKDQHVFWPNQEEREHIVANTFDILPQCIGWIDGTQVCLEEAPKFDKDSYYNKDKRYSIQAQIICDDKKRIRHYVTGYPGSVHDSRVWSECNIAKNLGLYFTNDQWLSADSGYGLTKYMMTPFRQNCRSLPLDRVNKFNTYYSSHRIKIEHVNGALKETFGSLKELRVKIDGPRGHKRAVEWIEACLILYNIVMPLDNWIPSDNPTESSSTNSADQPCDDFTSEDKRMALFHHIMHKIRNN